MPRKAIFVDEETHRRLKIEAAERNISMGETVTKLLDEQKNKQESDSDG